MTKRRPRDGFDVDSSPGWASVNWGQKKRFKEFVGYYPDDPFY